MLNKIKREQKGFTIIEVLIVLAIAGLIMLIVFLAVPALQRTQRNTAIRNDAGNVLSGVSEFVSNNNGQLPTDVSSAPDGTVTILSKAAGTQQNTTKVRPGTTVTTPGGGPAAPKAAGTINFYPGQKCNGNTAYASSPRSYLVTFLAESGSGNNPSQCLES